mmetsp:Transcript_27971/g.64554  ORF Transcript_27971/g.64554 Transcript_27971/m.64554 type:complete len:216 (-) Transcript_27971:679-1326(-)
MDWQLANPTDFQNKLQCLHVQLLQLVHDISDKLGTFVQHSHCEREVAEYSLLQGQEGAIVQQACQDDVLEVLQPIVQVNLLQQVLLLRVIKTFHLDEIDLARENLSMGCPLSNRQPVIVLQHAQDILKDIVSQVSLRGLSAGKDEDPLRDLPRCLQCVCDVQVLRFTENLHESSDEPVSDTLLRHSRALRWRHKRHMPGDLVDVPQRRTWKLVHR